MSRGAGGAVTIPGTCGQRHSWWERCRWIQRPCARTWTSIRVDASGAGNGRHASPQTAQRFPVVCRSRTSSTMGSVAQPRRPGRALPVMMANRCKDCGRQFVQCSDHYRISGETRALPERLLRECISLRGMCRAIGAGLTWLVGVLVTCFEALPDHWHIQRYCRIDVYERPVQLPLRSLGLETQRELMTSSKPGQQMVNLSAEISDCMGSVELLKYPHLALRCCRLYFAAMRPSCSSR
jgi:hypothetical protein